jgi:hypothetical protein
MSTREEWVGLTDEEVFAIAKELGLKCSLGGNPNIDIDYARAIEQLLKRKNTLVVGEDWMVQPPCKTHPDAPHGFSRNASHNAGRVVCECEHWKENT